jgi:hypothetical protein
MGTLTPFVAMETMRPCNFSISSMIAIILLSLLDVNSERYVIGDW